MKKADQKMWFITGVYGLYYGSNWPTRREAIKDHVERLGSTWEERRERGDSAVRLQISQITKESP